MKRHSNSASRSVEVQQNEVNERKRARVSDRSSKSSASESETDNDIKTPVKIPVCNSKSKSVDFSENDVNSDLNGVKASTPVSENGVDDNSEINHNVVIVAPDSFTPTKDLKDGAGESPAAEITNEDCNSMDLQETNGTSNTDNDEGSFCTSIDSATSDESTEDNQIGADASSDAPASEVAEAKSSDTATAFEPEYFLSSLLQTSQLQGHADEITAVAVDEEVILTASLDTTIKVWDPIKKKEICNFQGHSNAVNALVLLSKEQTAKFCETLGLCDTSKIAISGSTDCSIRLWSVDRGTEILFLYTYNGINCLDFFPDSCYVVIGTDGGKLDVWNLGTLTLVHSVLAHDDAITDLKVQDDGYVYTCSSDGKVKVWLFEENELQVLYTRSRKQPALHGDEDSLQPSHWNCLATHNGLMYLGDNAHSLKVLDWSAGKLRVLGNKDGFVTAVSAQENFLLSSSFDMKSQSGSINAWNLPNLSYVCTMSGNVGKVSSLAAVKTRDGIMRVVSGGEKLLVWDFVLNQKAASSNEDEYFCHEIENFAPDAAEKASDSLSSSSSEESLQGSKNRSFRCNIM